MNKHTTYIATLTILATTLFPIRIFGVTKNEMEQARVIAAKAYIRYANDGSGYLDDINPKTMDELEAALKPKEKENIKAFKAIAVPSDYEKWDKEKLLEYWAVTAFQTKGLIEKGRGGRIRARAQINKMTIAAPAEKKETKETSSTHASEKQSSTMSLSSADSVLKDSLDNITTEKLAILAQQKADEADRLTEIDKEKNYTWVYVMVLCILVAIMLALVVFAANVIKKNGADTSRSSSRQENTDNEEDQTAHYQSLLEDKDVEIAMLRKKLESVTKQNTELKSTIETLSTEVTKLSQRPSELHETGKPVSAKSTETPVAQRSPLRSIYLGRANMRGIFVRADRTLNIGHSIFRLDTTDGFTGTFKVADTPAAWSIALSNPGEYLATACTGSNIEDTAEVSRIVTENPGTAIFEGGCWRVIKKARIRYE